MERSSSPAAEAVSRALREGGGDWLARRRRVAALSAGAMGSLGVVAAYQFGLIRRPPEPALPFLDAAKVDASGEAYKFLLTPDAALGLLSYSSTVVLAGMGGGDRVRRRPGSRWPCRPRWRSTPWPACS